MSEVKIKENSFAEWRLTGTIIYANLKKKKKILTFSIWEKKTKHSVLCNI